VVTRFRDATGQWQEADPATVDAVLTALGAYDSPSPAAATVITTRLDRPRPLPAGELHLEQGGSVHIDGRPPADLPPGYHRLEQHDGPPVMLVASPGRAPLPGGRTWGFASQLYATRSARSWGMGDLADLRHLASWSASMGAGLVAINPLHASSPTVLQEPSPYFPSSRCFLNPLYLAVDEVPAAGEAAALPAAARVLNTSRLIDRDRVWSLKQVALERIFAGFDGDPDFDAYLAERGDILTRYATYCAISERHGPRWHDWPAELRGGAEEPAVRRFIDDRAVRRRVRYHQWLQWHLDRQLQTAAGALPVMQDLAVGVDPAGADTWMWSEVFAGGVRVGAPPDAYNLTGQNWGLPPFDPWRLRAAGYEPWIQSLRGVLRHSAGLRVDHVMGLFRLYWIPEGQDAAHGAYVRYAAEELLDILTLEAHRAGAFVVGEDLGTVEPGVRRRLADRDVLSYKVLWFERQRPPAWPAKALAAVTTHDLPTIAGVWNGKDPDAEASKGMRRRLRVWTGVAKDAPATEVIRRVTDQLATAPCLVRMATLDDALGIEERPNLPGTVEEWPNWRLALPQTLEQIEQMELPRAVAASLSRRRRRRPDRS
jgi:4-alpha-glucanotransferase